MLNVRRSATVVKLSLALQLIALISSGAGAADHKPPQVGDKAQDFQLMTLDGNRVKLSEQVKSGPIVLVVLRGYPGYQCPLCTKQFGDFLQAAEMLKKSSASVVFVYPGPSDKLKERAKEFVQGKDYPNHFQLVLDPDYEFTNAYGLRWDAKGETAYPSTFVIDSEQKVTFAKVSKTHGDRSSASEVTKALQLTRKK